MRRAALALLPLGMLAPPGAAAKVLRLGPPTPSFAVVETLGAKRPLPDALREQVRSLAGECWHDDANEADLVRICDRAPFGLPQESEAYRVRLPGVHVASYDSTFPPRNVAVDLFLDAAEGYVLAVQVVKPEYKNWAQPQDPTEYDDLSHPEKRGFVECGPARELQSTIPEILQAVWWGTGIDPLESRYVVLRPRTTTRGPRPAIVAASGRSGRGSWPRVEWVVEARGYVSRWSIDRKHYWSGMIGIVQDDDHREHYASFLH
ncbi:MAG: hypothetical protein R3B81_01710 [bacterium]